MTECDSVTDSPDLLTTAGQVVPTRSRRPIYLDMLSSYNAGCPAGENIQGWLRLIKVGQYEAAWQQLTVDNSFPTTHGRVCYRPCKTVYNRKDLDVATSIHLVERHLGNLALERSRRLEAPNRDSGRWVLTIGAGSSRLSAAYHLRRLGHEVETHDSTDAPGGMVRCGIPEHRLLRDVLDVEVAYITDIGVAVHNNTPAVNLLTTQVVGCFDAVFVVISVRLSKCVDTPSADVTRAVGAVSFLRDVAKGKRSVIGRRVAVYGGGSTVMDVARVVRRPGAEGSVTVYHRIVGQMSVHTEKRESAEQEGMRMNQLRTIIEMGEEDPTVETMELDKEDRAHGIGRLEKFAVDTAVLAIGQEADTGFLHAIPGMIFDRDVMRVDPDTLMTSVLGTSAEGDTVPNERTVIVSVRYGRKAARCIDRWLNLSAVSRDPKYSFVHLDQMNLWYFGGRTWRIQAGQAPETRVSDSGGTAAGLSLGEVELETQRCLSYGNYFECNGCCGAYPEDAVIKLGSDNRYRFDYERCTGCTTYYEQCPVHAIEMIPEGQ